MEPDESAEEELLESDDYEEVVEFECPLCNARVTDDDTTCPACGAIFVSPEEREAEIMEELEVDQYDVSEIELGTATEVGFGDEELDAEIAAMEARLDAGVEVAEEVDEEAAGFDLDLRFEDELEAEEEIEAAFGSAVSVEGRDHEALQVMSQPTIVESLFQQAGLGMFIAGALLSVVVLLWDPIQGETLEIGLTQLQFLVFSLSLFIVGFVVEMLQAYSLTLHDEAKLLETTSS
jgi:hypothetical protein